jgi:hypothetical protein
VGDSGERVRLLEIIRVWGCVYVCGGGVCLCVSYILFSRACFISS